MRTDLRGKMLALLGIVCVGLLVYLFAAMIWPEKF
ncbi:K(+)-transporting ATPase subunit F [Methylacidimicrobium tartarophylax]|nr:K(+)-transporting ATPase subunit F [Methylacidimicrobium tartarophylax]